MSCSNCSRECGLWNYSTLDTDHDSSDDLYDDILTLFSPLQKKSRLAGVEEQVCCNDCGDKDLKNSEIGSSAEHSSPEENITENDDMESEVTESGEKFQSESVNGGLKGEGDSGKEGSDSASKDSVISNNDKDRASTKDFTEEVSSAKFKVVIMGQTDCEISALEKGKQEIESDTEKLTDTQNQLTEQKLSKIDQIALDLQTKMEEKTSEAVAHDECDKASSDSEHLNAESKNCTKVPNTGSSVPDPKAICDSVPTSPNAISQVEDNLGTSDPGCMTPQADEGASSPEVPRGGDSDSEVDAGDFLPSDPSFVELFDSSSDSESIDDEVGGDEVVVEEVDEEELVGGEESELVDNGEIVDDEQVEEFPTEDDDLDDDEEEEEEPSSETVMSVEPQTYRFYKMHPMDADDEGLFSFNLVHNDINLNYLTTLF